MAFGKPESLTRCGHCLAEEKGCLVSQESTLQHSGRLPKVPSLILEGNIPTAGILSLRATETLARSLFLSLPSSLLPSSPLYPLPPVILSRLPCGIIQSEGRLACLVESSTTAIHQALVKVLRKPCALACLFSQLITSFSGLVKVSGH